MSKIFIDTNILTYTVDNNDKAKQKKCRNVLRTIIKNNNGVISTQVLQEFFVAMTKKLGINPLNAKDILHSFRNFETVIITPDMINSAVDCSILKNLSFWDSLIVVSAEHAKCTCLFTEDLNAGQIINGVEIVNPMV